MPYPDRAWSDIWPGREDRVVGILTGNDYAEVTGLRAPDRSASVRVPFTGIATPGSDATTRSYWWMDIVFAAGELPPGEFGSGYVVRVAVGRADTASQVRELGNGYEIEIQAGLTLDNAIAALEALAEIDSVTLTPRYAAAAADTGTDIPDPFQRVQTLVTEGFSARRQASALVNVPLHNATEPAIVEVVLADALGMGLAGNGWTFRLADNAHEGARAFGNIPAGEGRGLAVLDSREVYFYYNRNALGWASMKAALEGLVEVDAAYLRYNPVSAANLNWRLPGAVTQDAPFIDTPFERGRDYVRSRVELVTTEAHRATNSNWQRVVTFATVRKDGSPPAATDDSQSFIVTDNPVRLELAPDEALYMRHTPVGTAAPGVSAWNSSARVWDIDSRS